MIAILRGFLGPRQEAGAQAPAEPKGSRKSEEAARAEAGNNAIRHADQLRDAGRPADAAEFYRKAVELFPHRTDIRVQLGNMLKDAGQFAAAEDAYRDAVIQSPNEADIHLQLGRALKLAGTRDAAIAAFRRALELAPGLEAAADELGRILPIEPAKAVPAPGPGKPSPKRPAAAATDATGFRSSLSFDKPGYVIGWAFDPNRVDRPVKLDVEINDVPYLSIHASLERGDLKRIAPRLVGGGFELPIPPGRGNVMLSLLYKGQHLRGSPRKVSLRAKAPLEHAAIADRIAGAAAGREPIAIVIPVYNAAEEVAACLASVLAHTTLPARLIVIDDASTDPRIPGLLRALEGKSGLEIIRNTDNLGYTRTVNKGLSLAGKSDVVLLNSDAMVGPRWLEGLRTAAYARNRIATVTAVSDNAGAFSVPEMDRRQPLPAGLSEAAYQRLVMQKSGALWPEVPTGSGFCLYMRRDAIDAVGTFDAEAFPRGYGEENDWCMRALRAGWQHVVDDRTMVLHERSASFGASKTELLAAGRSIVDERYPDYGTLIKAFHTSPALAFARLRVRRLHQDLAKTGEDPVVRPRSLRDVRPRVLFVISTETGGTPLTNRDLMNALSRSYEPWLLSCDTRTMTLSKVAAGQLATDRVIDMHTLIEPVSLVEHRSANYNAILARWLIEYSIELVHVRHLAWHSLDLPSVAKGLDIPVILSFHDFYTVCPTVKLLDERMHYCGGRCTASEGDCTPDLWRSPSRPPLKNRWITEWRRKHSEVFQSCAAFVTTSESARRTVIDSYPALAETRFEVIPHGRDFTEWLAPQPPPVAPLDTIDILVPGNISPAKGRDLIARLHALDHEKRLRFHILGDCNPALVGERIINYGVYKRDEFAARARETGARIGAVLSIWSETWCHTLTEMWAIGLPVVAFDFGAVAERIRASGAGWIVPHESIEELYSELRAIADTPEDIATKLDAVRRWQMEDGRINTCDRMAERYSRLYSEVVAGRQTFAGISIDQPGIEH
ncbi:MAG: glycosyltransferase [Hyphomicrobiaceae bacterium]